MSVGQLVIKMILVATLLGAAAGDCFGQRYWQRIHKIPGIIDTVLPTTDGNFIAFGTTPFQGAPDGDILALKFKPNGDTLWSRRYGGAGTEIFNSLVQLDNGTFFVIGQTNSYGAGGFDFVLLKIRPDGDTVFTKTYGGKKDDLLDAHILLTRDSTLIFGGTAPSIGPDYRNFWILNVNQSGDTLWTKTLSYGETGTGLMKLNSDGYDLLYASVTSMDRDGYFDVRLIKLSTDGRIVWNNTYGEPGFNQLSSMQPAGDGEILLAIIRIVKNDDSCHNELLRIRPDGTLRWKKSFAGGQTGMMEYMVATPDGGCILGGCLSEQPLVTSFMKIASDGTSQWTNSISERCMVSTMLPSTSGHYTVTTIGNNSFRIVTIDENGETMWSEAFGTSWAEDFRSICPAGDNAWIVCGAISSLNWYPVFTCLVDNHDAFRNIPFSCKIPLLGSDSLDYRFTPLKTPATMTVSRGGTIAWTPATDSVYTEHIRYIVENTSGRNDTLKFSIRVNGDKPSKPSTGLRCVNSNTTRYDAFSVTTCHGSAEFTLPPAAGAISIYDISGRLVGKAYPAKISAGAYAVWPGVAGGRPVPAGKYFARMAGGMGVVKSFVLVR